MMRWMAALALLLLATQASAQYQERFDDPLGGWRDRWLAQYSNMTSYYVCTGEGDENYRGNNPCGIWICDTDDDFMTAIIRFIPNFAEGISHLSLGIQAFTESSLHVYDKDGAEIFSAELTVDFSAPYGCYTQQYSVDSSNGMSGFSILPTGSGPIEGNTAIDNVEVLAILPVAIEQRSWGGIKALYR